jgi:predicted acetyltransferase
VPKIDLVPATLAQQPIVANLLQLYIHDFSEFLPLEIGPDGTFVYPDLPLYWQSPRRHPFLIQIDGNWAGFVLVKTSLDRSTNQPISDIAEFFILRAYRRLGIGTQVAHAVWRRFPGPWTVRVMQSNHAALSFWKRAISAFTGLKVEPSIVERNGQSLFLFSFVSPPALTH